MNVLKEIPDKNLLVDALKKVSDRKLNTLFVSTPPDFSKNELLAGDMHPWFRIITCLSGEYRFSYYNDGLKEAILPYDSLIMTLPAGGVLIDKCSKAHRCVQIVFRDSLIRYLIVENNITYWYHSSNPLQPCGQHIIKSLSSMPLSSDFDNARVKLCEALLNISLTELENDNPVKCGKAFNTYYSALEFMRSNLHDDIGRRIVSKACAVTPSHLSKLFARFGKEDFNQSLKILRIERSIFLLEKSPLSIGEIACSCGFKTSAHFIRIFRKINSVSPGRFRNSLKEKNGSVKYEMKK